MPRPAKVWKRSEDGWYYCTHKGEKVRLSADHDEAWEKFHALKASAGRARAPTAAQRKMTLGRLAGEFLDHARETKAAHTYERQRDYLRSFWEHAGAATRVDRLTGADLDDWTAARPSWGQSSRTGARAAVLACLNWGAETGRIAANPMPGMKRGTYKKRERVLSAAEKEKVLAAARGGLKDFLFALFQTGMRPYSEAAQVTASMVDWKAGSVAFEKHKNARKNKDRAVYLPPGLLERFRELARLRPEGPLLVTLRGKPWSRKSGAQAMRRLEKRSGVRKLTVYAARHTFITDALAKGLTADVVAELVGSSPRTIARYYSHLETRKDVLRDAARKAVGD